MTDREGRQESSATIHRHVYLEGPFSPVFHEAAELVGRRWTGAILYALAHDLHRFSELRSAIPGLSARLLSQRIRELESADVLQRIAASGSRAEYHLTEKGDALRPVLMSLNRWAVDWTADEDVSDRTSTPD